MSAGAISCFIRVNSSLYTPHNRASPNRAVERVHIKCTSENQSKHARNLFKINTQNNDCKQNIDNRHNRNDISCNGSESLASSERNDCEADCDERTAYPWVQSKCHMRGICEVKCLNGRTCNRVRQNCRKGICNCKNTNSGSFFDVVCRTALIFAVNLNFVRLCQC